MSATVKSMLARDPALANAQNAKGTSAVIVALFINKGEGFLDPAKNEMLHAILAAKPHLDIFETAALGTRRATRRDADAMPTPSNAATHFGWTLLHMSAFGGNAATTELLLKKGVRNRARAGSKFRNTPLQTALLSVSTRRRRSCSITAPTRWSASRKASRRCTKPRRADARTRPAPPRPRRRNQLRRGQRPNPVSRGHPRQTRRMATWMKTKGAVVGIQVIDGSRGDGFHAEAHSERAEASEFLVLRVTSETSLATSA